MAEHSNIEWCDHTFNPWTGCTKVSPGCDHCYADGWSKRSGDKVGKWGPGAQRVRTTPANWAKPLKWQANAEAFQAEHGRRQRVFCASLADVFDNEVPGEWRTELFALIDATPDLDWLLLTKRIGNAHQMAMAANWPFPWPRNVWLGATITSQAEADRDIPKLLAVPARVRFLSMEPLLGPVDLNYAFGIPSGAGNGSCPMHLASVCPEGMLPIGKQHLHWVIVGGESGPGARPMHPDWARSLRDQCAAAGVPFLFKQWGEWHPVDSGHSGKVGAWNGETFLPGWGDIKDRSKNMVRAGKSAFGAHLLDGIEHNGYPEVHP